MSQRMTRMNTNKESTNRHERLYLFNSCYSRNSLICYIIMRNFYLEYQICQTVSGKLTWSHYCELLGLNTVGIMSQRITRIKTNKNEKLYLLNSYNSRNSLTNSLIKKGEEIGYFV